MTGTESTPVASRLIGALSVRQKLTVTFSLVIIFITMLTILLVTYIEKGASLERARVNASMLGNLVRISLGEDIIRGNFRGLEYSMKEFSMLPIVRYSAILNKYGKIISASDPDLAGKFLTDSWTTQNLRSPEVVVRRAIYKGQPVSDACIPVRVGGEQFGVISLGCSLTGELDYLRMLLLGNLSLGLLFILIGFVISYSISRNILAPIDDLLSVSSQ